MSKNVKEMKSVASNFVLGDDLIFGNKNETDVLIREEAKFLASQMAPSNFVELENDNEDVHENVFLERFMKEKVSLEMNNHEKLYSMLEKNNEILIGILTTLSTNNQPILEVERLDSYQDKANYSLSQFNDDPTLNIMKEFLGKENSFYEFTKKNNDILINDFDTKLQDAIQNSSRIDNKKNIDLISDLDEKIRNSIDVIKLADEKRYSKISGQIFKLKEEIMETINSSLLFNSDLIKDLSSFFDAKFLLIKEEFINIGKEISHAHKISVDTNLVIEDFDNKLNSLIEDTDQFNMNKMESINEISKKVDKFNLEIDELRNESNQVKSYFYENKDYLNIIHSDLEGLKNVNNLFEDTTNNFKNDLVNLKNSFEQEKFNLNSIFKENIIEFKNEISDIKENFKEEKSNLIDSIDENITDFKNEIFDIKDSFQEERNNLNKIFENSFNSLKNDLLSFRESFEKDKSNINEANKEILTYLENKEMVKEVIADKEFYAKIEDTVQNKLSKNNSILNKNFNSLIEETKFKIQDLENEMSKLNYRKELDEILHLQTNNWNSIDISRNEIQDKINELELEIKNLNYRKELDGLLDAQFYYSENTSALTKEIQDKIFHIENDFLEKIQNVEFKIDSNLSKINELKDSYNSNEIDNLITDKLVAIVQEKLASIDSKMLFLKKEIENNLTHLIESQFEKNIYKNEEFNKKIKNETLNLIYSELNKFDNKFDNLNDEIIKNYDLLMINNRVLDTLEDLLNDQFSKKNDLDFERKNLIDELIKKAEDNKSLISMLQNKIDYSIDNSELYNSIIRKTISRDSSFLKEIDDQTYKYVKNLTLELVNEELCKYTGFVKKEDELVDFPEKKFISNSISDFENHNNELISEMEIDNTKNNMNILDVTLAMNENDINNTIDKTYMLNESIAHESKDIKNTSIDDKIYNEEILDNILHSTNDEYDDSRNNSNVAINDILYDNEYKSVNSMDLWQINANNNDILYENSSENVLDSVNAMDEILNPNEYIENSHFEESRISKKEIMDAIINDIPNNDLSIESIITEDIPKAEKKINPNINKDKIAKNNSNISNSEFDRNNIFQKDSNPYFKYKIQEILFQLESNENVVIQNEIGFYKTNLLNQNVDYLNPEIHVKELENYFSKVEDITKNDFYEGEQNG